MSRTLSQERADFALKVIKKYEKEHNAREYSSIIKRLPAMILQNGLGQSIAFLLAKSKDNKGNPQPQGFVYQDLSKWIIDRVYKEPSKGLIDHIISNNSRKYQQAQYEALALLNWMKKFADAFLPKEGGE